MRPILIFFTLFTLAVCYTKYGLKTSLSDMAKVQMLQVTASNFPISITLRWGLFLSPLAPVEVSHWLLLLTEAVT